GPPERGQHPGDGAGHQVAAARGPRALLEGDVRGREDGAVVDPSTAAGGRGLRRVSEPQGGRLSSSQLSQRLTAMLIMPRLAATPCHAERSEASRLATSFLLLGT